MQKRGNRMLPTFSEMLAPSTLGDHALRQLPTAAHANDYRK
jgi:hypothetical protein